MTSGRLLIVKHGPSQQILQRMIQAMEMRCFRKILHISYKDHYTNEEVRNKVNRAIGPYQLECVSVKVIKYSYLILSYLIGHRHGGLVAKASAS